MPPMVLSRNHTLSSIAKSNWLFTVYCIKITYSFFFLLHVYLWIAQSSKDHFSFIGLFQPYIFNNIFWKAYLSNKFTATCKYIFESIFVIQIHCNLCFTSQNPSTPNCRSDITLHHKFTAAKIFLILGLFKPLQQPLHLFCYFPRWQSLHNFVFSQRYISAKYYKETAFCELLSLWSSMIWIKIWGTKSTTSDSQTKYETTTNQKRKGIWDVTILAYFSEGPSTYTIHTQNIY